MFFHKLTTEAITVKEACILQKIILILANSTVAARTGRLLGKGGIAAEVVRLDDPTESGCAHGVSIPYPEFINAVSMLHEHRIAYSVRNV